MLIELARSILNKKWILFFILILIIIVGLCIAVNYYQGKSDTLKIKLDQKTHDADEYKASFESCKNSLSAASAHYQRSDRINATTQVIQTRIEKINECKEEVKESDAEKIYDAEIINIANDLYNTFNNGLLQSADKAS
jgi:predicted RND superfamily exporter protein